MVQATAQLERAIRMETVAARLREITHSFGRPPHVLEVLHSIDLNIHARQLLAAFQNA